MTRHPVSVPCDCVFSIFVNDTGLNFAHVQRVGAPSLCSPVTLLLFLSLSLFLPFFPSFSPLVLASSALSPFLAAGKNFDQRRPRSRRTCDDQWGINARRGHREILSLSSRVPRTTYSGKARTINTETPGVEHGRRRRNTHGQRTACFTLTAVILAGISNENARWVH